MRVRVPIADNPAGRPAIERCEAACRAIPEEPSRSPLCLASCPGAVINDHDRCGPDDQPPLAYCVVAEASAFEPLTGGGRGGSERAGSGGPSAGEIALGVGRVTLDVFAFLFEVLITQSSKGGASGHRRTANASHHRASPSRASHRPASPSRAHAPARPTR